MECHRSGADCAPADWRPEMPAEAMSNVQDLELVLMELATIRPGDKRVRRLLNAIRRARVELEARQTS